MTPVGERGVAIDAMKLLEGAEWSRLISKVALPCGEPCLSSSETSGNPVRRGKMMLVFGGDVPTIFIYAVRSDYKRLRSRIAPVG